MTRDAALQLALGYGSLFEARNIPAQRYDGIPPLTRSAELAHAYALISEAIRAYPTIIADPSCNLREAVSIAQFVCYCDGMFTWEEIEKQRLTGVIAKHVVLV
jgi:hypothetical protein